MVDKKEDIVEINEEDLEREQVDVPPSKDDVEPSKPDKPKIAGERWWRRFWHWCKSHKKFSIPIAVIVLLILLAAIPPTRYMIAGTFMKKEAAVSVVDSKTGKPVTSVSVSVGTVMISSSSKGIADFKKLKPGKHTATLTKKYYKDSSVSFTVGVLSSKVQTFSATMQATGRQVDVKVTNKVNGKVLNNVLVKTGDVEAKTNEDGIANLVVAPGTQSANVQLSADGYNDQSSSIVVSDSEVKLNNLTLTPSGKVYFLSKQSGTIDVVKTNLDGTDRQTVLSGTGNEDDQGTVLLASRDWKYLALESRRDDASDPAKLYLIETDNDKLTTMDEGNASYTLVGWDNSNFVYSVYRNGYNTWQPKREAIKSYSADTKQLVTLDQTDAQGTSDADSAYQTYSTTPYLAGDDVVFSDTWYSGDYNNQAVLADKQTTINSIPVGGGSKQTLKSFGYSADGYISIQSIPYEPNTIYFQVSTGNSDPTYYSYDNGKFTTDSSIKDDYVKYSGTGTITYLLSPAGDSTFWSESRDGKNTLFIGDQDGQNGKEIANLSEYKPYGWYTEDYLLVSKDSDELYVMPSDGLSTGQQPLKMSDYHKPAATFNGYGGGYGGN